jgi:hypothetical protein
MTENRSPTCGSARGGGKITRVENRTAQSEERARENWTTHAGTRATPEVKNDGEGNRCSVGDVTAGPGRSKSQSFPLVPLLIHLHPVLLLPLLSLPFAVLSVSEDPQWIGLGHGTRHLMTRKVRAPVKCERANRPTATSFKNYWFRRDMPWLSAIWDRPRTELSW